MSRSVVTQIEIKAPRERVFDAWTDPKLFVRWWGSEGIYTTSHMESDLRVGGSWKSIGQTAKGTTIEVGGEYLEIDRPSLLEFTWQYEWESGEPTVVRIELHETSAGTLLKLNHTGFATDESRDQHEEGWTMVLQWNADFLANG